MILGAAYRSISLKEEGILVGQGKVITMEDAHRAGLGEIFDRVVVELVGKMEEMKMVSFCSKAKHCTVPTDEILSVKNARARVSTVLYLEK